MKGLTEGRIVHYVLVGGISRGEHRPAIVVKVWRTTDPNLKDEFGNPVLVTPENGVCNLQIFTDSDEGKSYNDNLPPMMWQTSVLYDETGKPGTWHWIEAA